MRDSDWAMALVGLMLGGVWVWSLSWLRGCARILDSRGKVLDSRSASLDSLSHALDVRSAALDEREHRLIIREALLTRPSNETIARNWSDTAP